MDCGLIGLENGLLIRIARGLALRGTNCAVMVFGGRYEKYVCVITKMLNAEYTLLFEHSDYQARITRNPVMVPDMITESLNRPKIMLQISAA
jgi:hypothetical protein